jgi:hypothetical protein
MPLTIVNGSAQTLPMGYQIGVSYPFLSAPCIGQRDDVRFIYGPVTELNRVFDDVSPPWAWFPLIAPLAPGATSTGEYFIYCGNIDPGSGPSNPKTLFELHDAFGAASIDTNTWTVVRGATLSNGRLVVGNSGNQDNGVITATASFGPNHAVDFVAIPSLTTTPAYGFWGGFQATTANNAPYALWWTSTTTGFGPTALMNANNTAYQGATVALTTTGHYFGVEHYGDHAMYRYDDAPYDTHAYDESHDTPLYVRLWNYNSTPSVAFDMVRVRQAVDPPPTVTVGTPEMKP